MMWLLARRLLDGRPSSRRRRSPTTTRTPAGGRSDVQARACPYRAVQCAARADSALLPIARVNGDSQPDMRKIGRPRPCRTYLSSFGRSGMQSVEEPAGRHPEADTRVSDGRCPDGQFAGQSGK